MADQADRHRALLREFRRGLRIWQQALFTFARDEPDVRHATLAREIGKLLSRANKAIGAWNGDGTPATGDRRSLPPPRHRPPVTFDPFPEGSDDGADEDSPDFRAADRPMRAVPDPNGRPGRPLVTFDP